jgi:uncharacterized OB-fold protein
MSARPVATMVPNPDWAVARGFWEATARGELRFPRCTSCGTFQWYPRARCRECRSSDFEWTLVAPHGTVFSYTIVRRPFLDGADRATPFAVLQVQFDEAPGVTLVTNLADESQADKVRIGAPISIEFHRINDRTWMPYATIEASSG